MEVPMLNGSDNFELDDFEPEPDTKRDRANAVAWAKDFAGREDWLLLDTETTALDGRVVEIAIVKPDGSTLFESLVNPGCHIPNSHLHGITDEMVKDAPSFGQIELALASLLHGRTVVVYNAAFDVGILRREVEALSGDAATSTWRHAILWQCAMLQYAAFVGEWSDRHGSYRYHALGGGHRAAGDCRACLERIREMAASSEISHSRDEEDEAPARAGEPVCPRCKHADGWSQGDGYCMRCHDWVSKESL